MQNTLTSGSDVAEKLQHFQKSSMKWNLRDDENSILIM